MKHKITSIEMSVNPKWKLYTFSNRNPWLIYVTREFGNYYGRPSPSSVLRVQRAMLKLAED